MLTIGSPLPKRSRLSLRKTNENVCLLQTNNACLVQASTNMDVSTGKPTAISSTPVLCKLEVETPTVKEESCETQDENVSPNANVSLMIASKYFNPIVSCTKLNPSEIANFTKDRSYSTVVGLPNCGNTCYLNSVLQVLRYTPNFLFSLHKLIAVYSHQRMLYPSEFQEDSEVLFFYRLHMLFAGMKRQETLIFGNAEEKFNYNELLEPVDAFIALLRSISPQFKEDEQHDSHEFLLTLISAFSLITAKCQRTPDRPFDNSITESERELSPQPSLKPIRKHRRRKLWNSQKRSSKSLKMIANFLNPTSNLSLSEADIQSMESLNQVFEGKLTHIVRCLECEIKQEREEVFYNIDVQITVDIDVQLKAEEDADLGEEDADLESVLLTSCLSQSTILTGENKYYCSHCARLNEAKLSSEIAVSPSVLLLHISWLSQSSEITDIEKTSTRILIPFKLETSQDCQLFSRLPEQSYKLYAIILHIGASALGGHYVCFVNISAVNKLHVNSESTSEADVQLVDEIEKCCRAREIRTGNSDTDDSSWYLMDDERVAALDVKDMNCFPYFEYLGSTATPCMIFYQRT